MINVKGGATEKFKNHCSRVFYIIFRRIHKAARFYSFRE